MAPNSEDSFDPWDDAHIEKAQSIIKMDPDSPIGYSNLGEILYYREKYEEAVTHLMKAVEIIESGPLPPVSRESPDGTPVFNMDNVKYAMHVNSTYGILGDCHLRLKNPEEGEIWLKKALDVSDETGLRPPDDSGQWARYGQALARQDKWRETAQPIRNALTLEPSKEFFWKLLLEVYDRTGRSEAANIASVFEEGRSPDDKLLILADTCTRAADYYNAEYALSNFKRSNQDDPRYLKRLGHIKLLKREYDGAIGILEPLFKKEPQATHPGFLLARVLIFVGRWNDAEKVLAKIVQTVLAELHDKKSEQMMSRLFRSAPPPQSEVLLESAARFLHLMIQIRNQPTQRFRLLVYGKNFMEEESFQLYPDIVVPSGTTVEDLLHWSRTRFDDLFPKGKEIISSFMSGRVIQSISAYRPEVLAMNEPGSFSLSCTNESYEEERGEGRPATPGGRFPIKYMGFRDPILTGDTITLLPENLANPPPDHTASQMSDHRFRMQAVAAHGLLSGDTREIIHLRDKKIAEQMSDPHPFAGVVPKDKSESIKCRLALVEYYISENNLSAAEFHLQAVKEKKPKEKAVKKLSRKIEEKRKSGSDTSGMMGFKVK